MNRQHMKLVDAHEPIHDAVWRMHNLTDQRIFEFWNRPARFRERDQPIRRRYEAGDDDRRVMRRVLTDERVNRGQVGSRLLGPEDNPHDRNCFLTSS